MNVRKRFFFSSVTLLEFIPCGSPRIRLLVCENPRVNTTYHTITELTLFITSFLEYTTVPVYQYKLEDQVSSAWVGELQDRYRLT